MAAAPRSLPQDTGGNGEIDRRASTSERRERRDRTVRSVEYAPYPRTSRGQRMQVGFTRDSSESGMCLVSDHAIEPGELQRVIVQGASGQPTLDVIVRVVWCQLREDRKRFWVGLETVAEGRTRLLRVHHTRRQRRVAVLA